MCHSSQASLLVWGIISSLLGIFLLYHLWAFDRFKCLRWNHGQHSGAFKRLMIYSYLLSIPMTITYSLGFAAIKYQEGFIEVPDIGIVPKPSYLWSHANQQAIFPLYLTFSISWSFEIVTHLEELCFWLFLVNAGSATQDWCSSIYFRTWTFGSAVAVIYMPLVTVMTRGDPHKNEAFTFLAGSLGGLSLTLWFIRILWTFPSFMDNLRKEGIDMNTVVRLTKFHELNTLRIYFRFLFTLPLLALGVDGVLPHPYINTKMFWTDILTVFAGLGCVISSAITIVIFFPRSIEGEIAIRQTSLENRREKSQGAKPFSARGTYLLSSSPVNAEQRHPRQDSFDNAPPSLRNYKSTTYDDVNLTAHIPSLPMQLHRGFDADEEERGLGKGELGLTETSVSNQVSARANNFTSHYGFISH